MFNKILIANRGEVALRIIKACKKLKIKSLAIFSTADQNSPHLLHADESVCIGPGPSRDSYLNMEAILQTATNYQCQAIHPGFGFMAEDPLFAYMCQQQKLTFIGPHPNSITRMGNKSLAKKTMEKAGLTTIPGSIGNLTNLQHALTLAQELKFPILLKATAGGGGKGIRLCNNEKDIKSNFHQAQMEAHKAFGSNELYMEKLILNGRHIEFQILADSYNNVIHLGERECSIQRKNQKLIEESPSLAVHQDDRKKIGNDLVKAIKIINYQNAGTIEFLMDESGKLYFMEMNTRLQVEHPVTEEITGIDIVENQIKIAANHALPFSQKDVNFYGHAIECRINAEDPANNFTPCPGKITQFNAPMNEGPGKIRIDSHIVSGYEIPSFYDSMICKIIAFGEDRPQAIRTMKKALEKFEIKGVKTTIPLHIEVLNSKIFQSGNYSTNSLQEIMGPVFGEG